MFEINKSAKDYALPSPLLTGIKRQDCVYGPLSDCNCVSISETGSRCKDGT